MYALSLLSIIALTLLVGSATPAVINSNPNSTSTSTSPRPKPTYQQCGGHTIKPQFCRPGYICIDYPYVHGCGMACDWPGICVKPTPCGGFAGLACRGGDGKPDGRKCIDDPRDSCDPKKGGADCIGICV